MCVASVGLLNVGLLNESFISLIQAVFSEFNLIGSVLTDINQTLQHGLSTTLGALTNGQYIHCLKSHLNPSHFLVATSFGNIHTSVAYEQIVSMSRHLLPY